MIIITGYPTLESAKEAVALGAYDYLTKPVGPDQVIDASNAAMQHKRWALHNDDRCPRARPARPRFSRSTGWVAEQTRFFKDIIMSALRKVLVVDDDPVVGKSFNRVLSGKGYIVVTAEDGYDALQEAPVRKLRRRLHRPAGCPA